MKRDAKLKQIGAACRMIRVKHGATMQEIADKTGTTRQNVWAFELGRNNNAILYNYYMEELDKDFPLV